MNHCKYRISPREIVSFLINSSFMCCCCLRAGPRGSVSRSSVNEVLLHVLMATKLRGQRGVWCVLHVARAVQRKKSSDGRRTHESVTFKMCIFSSQLANICTWVGMPTVPYWLPAVTQEDRKMEDKKWDGGREGGRGWRWCEDTGPEAFFLSCFSFVSLMITKNMAARETRGRHQREKRGGSAETLQEKKSEGGEEWRTIFHVRGKKTLQSVRATTWGFLMQRSKWTHPEARRDANRVQQCGVLCIRCTRIKI